MRVVKLKKELKEVLRIYKYILHTLQKVERKTYAALRKKNIFFDFSNCCIYTETRNSEIALPRPSTRSGIPPSKILSI